MIIVSSMDGQHSTCDVSPTDSIKHIKARIQDKQGLPADQQRSILFFGKTSATLQLFKII
jgi:hypothetical protein